MLALFFICIGAISPSLASDREGGGGTLIVCRSLEDSGNFDMYDLMDFATTQDSHLYKVHNTKHRPDLNSLNMNEMLSKIIGEYKEISFSLAKNLETEMDYILNHILYEEISFLGDIGKFKEQLSLRNVCPEYTYAVGFEQLAIYHPDRTVSINLKIWPHLDEFTKAALIFHEAIYALVRDRIASSGLFYPKDKIIDEVFAIVAATFLEAKYPGSMKYDLYKSVSESLLRPSDLNPNFIKTIEPDELRTIFEDPNDKRFTFRFDSERNMFLVHASVTGDFLGEATFWQFLHQTKLNVSDYRPTTIYSKSKKYMAILLNDFRRPANALIVNTSTSEVWFVAARSELECPTPCYFGPGLKNVHFSKDEKFLLGVLNSTESVQVRFDLEKKSRTAENLTESQMKQQVLKPWN